MKAQITFTSSFPPQQIGHRLFGLAKKAIVASSSSLFNSQMFAPG
jgi:hypothetical protein